MLNLLVTAHSQGDFAYFPRLYTALKPLKNGSTVLLDTGLAWSSNQWACQATENRAPYLVLDAMGYTAAFTDGLTSANRQKIEAQTQWVDPAETLVLPWEGQLLHLHPKPEVETIFIENGIVFLPLPPFQTIYQATLDLAPLRVIQAEVHQVAATTLPDATIAAAVEFVLGEARYYQKQKAKHERAT